MKQMNKYLFKLIESDYYQLTPQLTDMPILKSYYKSNKFYVIWFGIFFIWSLVNLITLTSILGIFNFLFFATVLIGRFVIHHRAVSLKRFKSNNIEFVYDWQEIIEQECKDCDRPIKDCKCEHSDNVNK